MNPTKRETDKARVLLADQLAVTNDDGELETTPNVALYLLQLAGEGVLDVN